MSKNKRTTNSGAMLELWRPPEGAGSPIGCLATTYTFAPGLFDEQCLARFLEIESEPSREDLAFLLERENLLGSVYAGVLVDHTQAGVEHSLRWDVLPVRIRAAKQHAKLSLLAWTGRIRIIVASANLTDPGYRTNYEVAAAVDLTPDEADAEFLADAVTLLRSLILFVPGASQRPPEVRRAEEFLRRIEQHVRDWKLRRRRGTIRQLVVTHPGTGDGQAARSSLDEAVQACRGRGGSPTEAWVASPFFDADDETSRVTASLCKSMARGHQRLLWLCVPAVRDPGAVTVPRLAAPKALLFTPTAYRTSVNVEMLPDRDGDRNSRVWHAKMLALLGDGYSALMIGSSNFTCAGMGVEHHRNAEANLLTIVDRVEYGREVGQLEAVWPEMDRVADPEAAEWLGARPEADEEEQTTASPWPAGFLSASYRAGQERSIVLRLDPAQLPEDWLVHACGREEQELLSADAWHENSRPSVVELKWVPIPPPEKLMVRWSGHEAFLPLNVEDSRRLPPPAQLDSMSADDLLWILAAADPSAAYRAWASRQQPSDIFDADLDSAAPVDLDPLRRHDIRSTFLHRIRRRARVLAQLRANLQRPVWGLQALEWRLTGFVGVGTLADRLAREVTEASGSTDEALLTLADFLIVLREVDYQPSEGSLTKDEFESVFRPFLRELVDRLGQQVDAHRSRLSKDTKQFWARVVQRCRG